MRRLAIQPDLTARFQLYDGSREAQDVEIDGRRISFALVTRWGERTSMINFTATVKSGVLKGLLASDRGDTPFVGRKVKVPRR
jgi:hypothetical protein